MWARVCSGFWNTENYMHTLTFKELGIYGCLSSSILHCVAVIIGQVLVIASFSLE